MAAHSMAGKFQVLALGPVFRPLGQGSVGRRVVLLKYASPRTALKTFVVAVQAVDRSGRGRSRLCRQKGAEEFTQAVRIFCDYLLDQALDDDTFAEERFQAMLDALGHEDAGGTPRLRSA